MYPDDYDKALSKFLDQAEYEQLQLDLFTVTTMAFMAGWTAAGGELPKYELPPQLYQALLHRNDGVE